MASVNKINLGILMREFIVVVKLGLELGSAFFVEKSKVQFPRYISLLKGKFWCLSFPLGLLTQTLTAESH